MRQPSVEFQLRQILSRISAACDRVKRDTASVSLVAVSKKQSVDKMLEYCEAAEKLAVKIIFGENYLQELEQKRALFPEQTEFHFIGGIQTNKVKALVSAAELIQTVDSLKLLSALNDAAHKIDKVAKILLQVNISEDPNKRGFKIEQLTEVASYSNLKILGLMAITANYQTAEESRPDYRALKALSTPGMLLSMGMSQDFEVAIEEGATHIRVGTLLFGERS